MNNKTIKSVERRLLKKMMEDEKELRSIVRLQKPDGVPEQQLDGLMVKIEQLLGRIMVNQNKLMLQDITSRHSVTYMSQFLESSVWRQVTGDFIRSEVLCG